MATYNLRINGNAQTVDTTDADKPLLYVLRELGLTAAKFGCGLGQCGACTILVDGRRINSCLTLAVMTDGASVTTVEGLAKDGTLHPVQQAFLEECAFQCGYCTSGMIIATTALLERKSKPSELEIREWMNGHLCRCCGYPQIVKAVQHAAQTASA